MWHSREPRTHTGTTGPGTLLFVRGGCQGGDGEPHLALVSSHELAHHSHRVLQGPRANAHTRTHTVKARLPKGSTHAEQTLRAAAQCGYLQQRLRRCRAVVDREALATVQLVQAPILLPVTKERRALGAEGQPKRCCCSTRRTPASRATSPGPYVHERDEVGVDVLDNLGLPSQGNLAVLSLDLGGGLKGWEGRVQQG